MKYDYIIKEGFDPVYLAFDVATNKIKLLFILKDTPKHHVSLVSETLLSKVFNECSIYFENDISRTCSVISIENLNSLLDDVFIGFAQKMISIGKEKKLNNYNDILLEIENWRKLFKKQPDLGKQKSIGLWGELYTIYNSPNIDNLIKIWKGPEGGMVDFMDGNLLIEVKTSTISHSHHFSHSQIEYLKSYPHGLVYSYVIEKHDSDGFSIKELCSEIISKTDHKEKFLFLLRCAGLDLSSDSEELDVKYHLKSPTLIVYSDSIPKVNSYDAGIFDLRYQIDLQFAKEYEKNLDKIDGK